MTLVTNPRATPGANGQHAAGVVETVLARGQVAFGAVHHDRLVRFAVDLTDLLATGPTRSGTGDASRVQGAGPTYDVDALLPAAVADLLEELGMLSGRAVVSTFHEHRRGLGLPPDPDSDAGWRAFTLRAEDGSLAAELDGRYPVLGRLLDGAVASRVRLLGEVLSAADADWPALTALGLAPTGPLTRIAVSSGDAHNGGRRVAIVHTAGGRLVYKPRTLAIDAVMETAVELVNPHLEPTSALRLPRTLSRPGHGWQEWVAAASMTDLDQVRRHRYRLGAFLALFASLGSTDLHHENVIAAGEHPVFIDLETALQHQPSTDSGDAEGDVAMIRSPLLSTMLLPMRLAGQSLDVDMSGVGTVSSQTCTLASFSVLDPMTDAIRFERCSFEVQHGDNLARLGDVPVPTGAADDDLVLGFHDALAAVRAERDRLLACFTRAVLPVRQVVRPTHVYARFLSCSTHPDYLADPAERSRLFGRLRPARGVAEAAQQDLLALEVAALERHDVPLFEVDLDGRELRAPLDGSAAAAYDTPLGDGLAQALDDFLATPPEQLEHTVRMCLATARDVVALDALDARPDPSSYLSDRLEPSGGSLAASVTDLLETTALASGSHGHRAWLTPSMEAWGPDGGRLVFRPGDTTLYEGGGVPLLLASQGAGDLARAAVPATLAVPDVEVPRGLSWFAGLPGVAHLHHELGVRLDDPALLARRDELVAQVLAVPPAPDHEVDLVGGVSATAAWLTALAPWAPAYDGLTDFLDASVARMRAGLATGDLPAGELAHGDLGVAWCLARVSAHLGHDAGLADAASVLSRHVSDLEAGLGTGRPGLRTHLSHAAWCKGTAGSLTALAEALPLVGWLPEEVDRVVDRLADRAELEAAGIGRDLTPCHGAAGVVQALARASVLRGRPALLDRARTVLAARRARIRREGYVGGLAGSQGFLGYMLGLTGVAHTEILLDHPTWGSPLWLTPSPADQPAQEVTP